MSPATLVTWSDAAQKFFLPIFLMGAAAMTTSLVSELKSLRVELQEVKIQVVRIQTKLDLLHSDKM